MIFNETSTKKAEDILGYKEFSLPHTIEYIDIGKESNTTQTVIESANKHENSFEIIENRIKADKKRIEKTCYKYRRSIDAWLANKIRKIEWNYFLEENKKLGYCVNPKVGYNLDYNFLRLSLMKNTQTKNFIFNFSII